MLSSCNVTAYPSLYIRVNQTFFEISPSTYLINATYQNVGNNYLDYCTIGLMPTSQNFMILGTAFMKNYYVIFDYERDAVGLSNLSTNSNIFNGMPNAMRQKIILIVYQDLIT